MAVEGGVEVVRVAEVKEVVVREAEVEMVREAEVEVVRKAEGEREAREATSEGRAVRTVATEGPEAVGMEMVEEVVGAAKVAEVARMAEGEGTSPSVR